MSTRSIVIVKNYDQEIWLYHHYDGYPEGVGFDLYRRSRKFGDFGLLQILQIYL